MPKYLRYVLQLALHQKTALISWALLLVVSVAARLVEPYLYKVVVDTLTDGLTRRAFTDADTQRMVLTIGIWFVLTIIMNIARAQSSYLVWLIGNRSSQVVHMAGYKRLLKLDYARHMKEHSSRLSKIVDDADVSTWEMTNWWLGRFASAILGFAGMLVIAFSVSWQMTLIAVSVIPPTLWFIIRHVKKYEDEQRRVNKMWEQKHEHLSDQVSNIISYKLNPHEQVFLERHDKYGRAASEAQTELNKKWRLAELFNPDAIARFLVLSVGIFFVRDGLITLGTLFMFMSLLNEILVPLHLLGDILPQYTRRSQHIIRLLDLIEQPDAVAVAASPVKPEQIRGEIVFDRVAYSYAAEGGSFELKDISFSVKPGQTVALVGHSGSGKTTLMTLLNRLVDPTEGAIRIDDVDLRQYDAETLKRSVGTVLQENAMYNESVAANIAYGDPEASRERIEHAAQQAFAGEFIAKLPQGYDTLIGERGVRLSGGEKQRVAIARAMLKDPKIVVLDEPTSALDSLTEQQVQRGLNELMKGRTTLIIAHRLSTVRNSDVILVMAAGRIICSGSHEELMKSCDTYKRMVDLQVQGFLADK